MDIELDMKKTLAENAGEYYDKAKKMKRKIPGVEKAIEDVKRQLAEIESMEAEQRTIGIQKKMKAEWYEKFRWFRTSDNRLVIAGKDATTNEIILKKHTQSNAVVFHADISGAPFTVLNESEGAPEGVLEELAIFSVCHSSAWKEEFGAADTYWVKPEQVTKSAPSGEYLTKGAFVIKGTKNYFRKVQLRLAIGAVHREDEVKVISGPESAVKAKTAHYVIITPGRTKTKELVPKIIKKLKWLMKEDGARIDAGAVQQLVPYGTGDLL